MHGLDFRSWFSTCGILDPLWAADKPLALQGRARAVQFGDSEAEKGDTF
jgi:hypothetical protein